MASTGSINFNNPNVGKPANLKNSAVLRMLEEEENRQRNGIGPGAKRVAWPPPSESGSDSPYVEQNSVSAQVAPRAAPASKQAQPPPPTTITLRPKAPVSQAPPPLVTSQPATATLKVSKKNLRGDIKWPPEDVKRKIAEENLDSNDSFLSIQGGKHLRGDLKWPPECVRQQFAEEDRLRLELAQGPACRPLRPHKDYSEFFNQHALNSTYPGYKIPPGTQFFRPV